MVLGHVCAWETASTVMWYMAAVWGQVVLRKTFAHRVALGVMLEPQREAV